MLFVDIGFGLFFVRIAVVAALFKQKRAFFLKYAKFSYLCIDWAI